MVPVDKTTFRCPLLHNCLSVWDTPGCRLLGGGVVAHTDSPYRAAVSLVESSQCFIKSPNVCRKYLHIHKARPPNEISSAAVWQNSHSWLRMLSQMSLNWVPVFSQRVPLAALIITAQKNSPCKHRKHVSKHSNSIIAIRRGNIVGKDQSCPQTLSLSRFRSLSLSLSLAFALSLSLSLSLSALWLDLKSSM